MRTDSDDLRKQILFDSDRDTTARMVVNLIIGSLHRGCLASNNTANKRAKSPRGFGRNSVLLCWNRITTACEH